jgi:hypothetical protein
LQQQGAGDDCRKHELQYADDSARRKTEDLLRETDQLRLVLVKKRVLAPITGQSATPGFGAGTLNVPSLR